LSTDGGASWDYESEYTIWDNKGEGMLTIPGGIELEDGSFFAAYALDNRTVGGTRFRLE